jgi:very-short-patch-repair endonuclease
MGKDKKNKFRFYEKENNNVAVFEKLCDKAKHIVFNALGQYETMQYFLVMDLPDELLEMTPIEQIFYVCKDIYDMYVTHNKGATLDFSSQEYVKANGKTYKVDFYVETFVNNSDEYYFNKPILIELDGHDYHSTKEQRNRDYERENNLKLAGYHIMRFTGSQVYNEPFSCVEKVYKYANQLVKNKEFH